MCKKKIALKIEDIAPLIGSALKALIIFLKNPEEGVIPSTEINAIFF